MISNVIDAWVTPITVTRVLASTQFVDGIAQPVTQTDVFTVNDCSVQPLTEKERVVLPELIRDRSTMKVYTKTELRTVDVAGKELADRVSYLGESWIVQTVQDWVAHGQYYKAILVKEND